MGFESRKSPEGTAENNRTFSRPLRACSCVLHLPRTNVLGYTQPSFRDSTRTFLVVTQELYRLRKNSVYKGYGLPIVPAPDFSSGLAGF